MRSNALRQYLPPSAHEPPQQNLHTKLGAHPRAAILCTLFDAIAICTVAGFICFAYLNSPSIGMGDETIYVRGAQGMEEARNYSAPIVDGSYFFGKPPLRIWLTPVSTALLGQSNFALRAPDALSGVLLALLVYALGRLLFASRAVGLLGVALLFGCKAYVLNHGPRMAVLDSLLVLLFSFVMLCGWKFLEELKKDVPSRQVINRWALLGGVSVGLSVLTKSGAGVVPLVVLAVFAALAGVIPLLLRRTKTALAAGAGAAAVIAAPYFVYHCTFSNGACRNLIGTEVVERAVTGFHNTDKPFFYLTRIFSDGAYLPPILLSASLLFALIAVLLRGDRRHLFLLCWAIVPVVFYSLMASRLTWYISPAAPAAALLGASFLYYLGSYSFRELRRWTAGGPNFPIAAYAVSLIALAGIYLTARNLFYVGVEVVREKDRLPLDMLSHAINMRPKMELVNAFRGKFAWDERAYLHMLRDRARDIADSAELRSRLLDGNFTGIVLTDAQEALELIRTTPATQYRFIEPHYDRPRWAAALNYGEPLAANLLLPISERINFGGDHFRPLFGWEGAGSFNRRPVRKMNEPHAGFLLHGDSVRRDLGTEVSLKLAYLRGAGPGPAARLELFVNSERVHVFSPAANRFSVEQFAIEPQVWQPGSNAFTIRALGAEGRELPRGSLMFDWMIIRPSRPALQQ